MTKGKPSSNLDFAKPATLPTMCQVASSLFAGFPFLRVDFYEVDGRLIVGELTLYPDAGISPFKPASYELAFGRLFNLPAQPVGARQG